MLDKCFRIFLFCSLFIISEQAFATDIYGTFKTDANLKIYVSIEDDYITHQLRNICESTIEEDGTFHLSFQLPDSISKVYIKTFQHIFSLYVHAKGKYELKLEEAKDAVLLYNKQLLKISSLQESIPKINSEIANIDSLFDTFFSKHYLLMIHPRSIKLAADTFKLKLKEYIKNYNEYSKEYAHYTMASIDEASGYREKYFFKNYTSTPPLHNKGVYYAYINQHFKNYFELAITKSNFGDGKKMINEQHNSNDLLKKLQACDSLLSIDSLREYLMIEGLSKLYYKREYSKSSIEMIMRYIAFNSAYIQNKKATKNFISQIEKLTIGSKAPNFELVNQKLDSVKLSDFKGVLTYLCFTTFDNFDWQTQLPILERLQLLYEKRIHIVVITMGNDMKQMTALWQQKKYAENVLNGFDELSLSEAYALDIFPRYFLIDSDGDILLNNQCSPIDGIEEMMKQYLKK